LQSVWSTIPHWSFSASAIFGVIGLVTSWIKWRDAQLRRSEVLAWSNQGIATMETLLLICSRGTSLYDPPELDKKLKELCVASAILVEQGRLFFKNQRVGRDDPGKEPAYRGLRPCILDPLVVAHQIALRWPNGNAEARVRMRLVAEKHLKMFVSLVQKEVGRSRTASGETKRGGDHIDLLRLMTEVDQKKVDKILLTARPEPNSEVSKPG
jgi:hypothetical protein